MILIPSATQLAQVTVAGDVDIASLGGGPMMAAVLSGADLKVIGNNVMKNCAADGSASPAWDRAPMSLPVMLCGSTTSTPRKM